MNQNQINHLIKFIWPSLSILIVLVIIISLTLIFFARDSLRNSEFLFILLILTLGLFLLYICLKNIGKSGRVQLGNNSIQFATVYEENLDEEDKRSNQYSFRNLKKNYLVYDDEIQNFKIQGMQMVLELVDHRRLYVNFFFIPKGYAKRISEVNRNGYRKNRRSLNNRIRREHGRNRKSNNKYSKSNPIVRYTKFE